MTPSELAQRTGVSERTLRRDLRALRSLGYDVTWTSGYELQERFNLDGSVAARTLAGVYEQQVRVVRQELPEPLAARVTADVDALAPAALASLFASAIERRLEAVR